MGRMRTFDIVFSGERYVFSPILGWLFRRPQMVQLSVAKMSEGEAKAMAQIADPYLLKVRSSSARAVMPAWHRAYIALLIWAARYCFPLLRLFLLLRLDTYADAGQASEAFYRHKPNGPLQKQLCLSRAVYVATTSRRFRASGTLFIGVFLPLVRMHAWVIEDGMHADVYDFIWINYQPVAIYQSYGS